MKRELGILFFSVGEIYDPHGWQDSIILWTDRT